MGTFHNKKIYKVISLISKVLNELVSHEDRELYSLIAVRNGGFNSMRIIDEILIKPRNANQIANILKLDYKTVTYHLDIICSHDYLIKEKFNNNYSYFPSEKLLKNLEEYNRIKESINQERLKHEK